MPKINNDNMMAVAILITCKTDADPAELTKATEYLESIDEVFVDSLRTVMWKSGYITKDYGTGKTKLSSAGEALMKKAEAEGYDINLAPRTPQTIELGEGTVYTDGEKLGIATDVKGKM